MTGLDVFLVSLGLVLVIISYFISEKITNNKTSNNNQYGTQEDIKELWSEKEELVIRDRIQFLIKDQEDEMIDKVEERLNQISNEKIMSVSEYSDQVIEKIDQNHQESIFLYNMLIEKQKEIKNIVNMVDKKKVAWEEEIINTQKNSKKENQVNHNNKTIDSLEQIEKPNKEKEVGKQAQVLNDKKRNNKENLQEPNPMLGQNQNERILDLKRQGKSLREISKMLNLGQGEVKLVIDLFQEVQS